MNKVNITEEQIQREITNINNAQSNLNVASRLKNYIDELDKTITSLKKYWNTEGGQTKIKEIENKIEELSIIIEELITKLNGLEHNIQYTSIDKKIIMSL